MAKGRKTVDVDAVVEYGNMLLRSNIGDASFRRGVISMIEEVLFNADRYTGYSHLTKDQLATDDKPGVDWSDGTPVIVDETRRRY